MNCKRVQSILNGTDEEAFSPTQFSAHLMRCPQCQPFGAELLSLAPAAAPRSSRPFALVRVAALLVVALFLGRQFAGLGAKADDLGPVLDPQLEVQGALPGQEGLPNAGRTPKAASAPLLGRVVLTSPVRRERVIAVMTPRGPGMITVREQIERSRILPGIKTVEDLR